MARKGQASIQHTIESQEELESYVEENKDVLIFLEVYCEFCGPCLATGAHVRKAKLEIGLDNLAAARKNKLVRCLFGSNGIEICRVVEEELNLIQKEKETGEKRSTPMVPLDQMLPEEIAKIERETKAEREHQENVERLRTLTLAARKQRVMQRLAEHVKQLNFILFWPQCHKAHYDLYEKWDNLGLQVAAKEEVQLKEEDLKEVFYMGDVDLNEAAAHALMDGEVLVVMFKMFSSDDRDIIQLMRYGIYEEIPAPKENLTAKEKQAPLVPAFERYATISKTEREVRRDRYEARQKKLREEQEERDRLAREQQRLAQQAAEEKEAEEKRRQEEERMARIQAGLPAEPEVEEAVAEGAEGDAAGGDVTEGDGAEVDNPDMKKDAEKVEGAPPAEPAPEEPAATEEVEPVPEPEPVVEDFHSDVPIEDEEYIPPGGLFVPGLYSPPNDLAKANGLVFFFPRFIAAMTPIETEYLPPHVLVMFSADKRAEVAEVVNQYKDEILQMGVFIGEDPFHCEHVAYSFRQYEKMNRPRYKDKVALMVSRKRSLPLLQLAGLNPCYISSDVAAGERECITMFPVGYGDKFVEEESIQEPSIKEEPVVVATPEPEVQPVTVVEEEEKEKEVIKEEEKEEEEVRVAEVEE